MNKNLAKANIISDHYFIPTAKAVGYSDYVEGLAKANNIFAFNIPPDKSGGYSNPHPHPDKSGGNSNPHPHPDKSGGYSEYKSNYYH